MINIFYDNDLLAIYDEKEVFAYSDLAKDSSRNMINQLCPLCMSNLLGTDRVLKMKNCPNRHICH
jgi:hypothetical protein